jgi:hypothetical protein
MDHFKKTMLIKYLSPAYKDVVLSKKPENLHAATEIAVDFWKRKNNGKMEPPKNEISAISTDLKTLTDLPEDVLLFALNQKRSNNQN